MMLGRSKSKSSGRQAAGDQSQEPLLGDDERGAEVVFALDDDDEGESNIRHEESSGGRGPQGRTFAPPLRSTMQSREAEFELDSDVLDNDDDDHPTHGSDQRMPLLVGLADASAVRRNPDLPLHTLSNGATGGAMVNGRVVYDDDDDPSTRIDLAELAARQHSGGNILDSMFNMANSILGAGIIGLPYAVSQAGFFTGIVLLVVLAGVTDWTIRLIVRNAKLSGRTSYIDIMGHCYGSSGRAAVSFFQFAFAFGGMCAFGIIIGDTIPHVIRQLFPTLRTTPVLGILADRNFIVVLCTTCISYPLSLYRSISSLARASTFALIGMLIIVTTVLFEGSRVAPELKGTQSASVKFSFMRPQIFQAIGVISFAFVCHHNSLLIYGSLRTPTMDRFDRVTHVAAGVSLIACLTLAVPAFLVFTDRTQGNVLNNFPQDDTVINIARFCFGANMVTTTPMELMVCREVIEEYFFAHEVFDQTRHVLFTTSILFSSMVVALLTCDLGVMLEITGGASATALAFVFPALCYIKLLPAHEAWHSRAKLPAVVCAAFGLVVLVLSVGLALGKSWGPEGSAKICL
ncbi:Transmembrane amino acid transporter protein [Ceratobasidium sp. AG-Ba]|nr:Transmembrane amino acid transporter protein [Ceratobasidium sp. AG-Ba]